LTRINSFDSWLDHYIRLTTKSGLKTMVWFVYHGKKIA
jgi:hypothetical protein